MTGPTSESVIRTADLHKTYGSTHALDGLDLTVARGEVHGFLGPNGSGKSTTIRVLLGLTRADGGEATVLGGDPWHDAVALHRRLAYVPAGVTLWPGLTGGQCIDVLGRAHGGIDEGRRAELVERFDLDTRKRTRDYSTGNKQKVSLVAALAADVELLLLDEPTTGLDPLMEQVFQEVVRERVADGATVLLSSHIPGGQCIDVLGRAHGGIDEGRRAELVERFDLDTRKRTRDYSTGNKQKVSLVAALAADVELLLLDEPTTGLDPLMEQVFQEVVRERVADGATVLLSSHILGEVEALADRVSIIRAGRTVTTGTLADLRRSTSSQVHAVTDDPLDLDLPGVTGLDTSTSEGRPEVRCHVEATAVAEVVGRVHAAGVHTLTITPPSLDDLFLEQYKGEALRDGRFATSSGTVADGTEVER